MHKLVAQEFIDNPDNKLEIDHIDNDKRNNSIINIRWASKGENEMNKDNRKQCSSNFKGVAFHKQHQTWSSYITNKTGRKHVGLFIIETDDARAYNAKAIVLFGAAKLKIL